MRAFLTSMAVVLAASTTVAGATYSNVTCATGLYILCARGSGEPVVTPNGASPDNTGSPGVLALEVAKQISGSSVAGVIYPAANPISDTGDVDLSVYYSSENKGAAAILQEVKQYHTACPQSKIALIGYSQGAQVVRDALCGGIGGQFNDNAPLPADLVNNNVVAVALMGDPTHIAGEAIDRGTSKNDGLLPRKNTTACKQYNGITASWCDKGDPFCDQGQDMDVHGSYFTTYGADIVKFVVDEWAKSHSGSVSTTTTAGSAPTGTSTGLTPSAAPGLRQNLLLGVLMVLVALSVC